jgi:hypothetical protein
MCLKRVLCCLVLVCLGPHESLEIKNKNNFEQGLDKISVKFLKLELPSTSLLAWLKLLSFPHSRPLPWSTHQTCLSWNRLVCRGHQTHNTSSHNAWLSFSSLLTQTQHTVTVKTIENPKIWDSPILIIFAEAWPPPGFCFRQFFLPPSVVEGKSLEVKKTECFLPDG